MKSTEDEVINLLFLVDLTSAVQNNSNMYFIMYIIYMLMYVYRSERMTAITKGWERGMRLIWLVEDTWSTLQVLTYTANFRVTTKFFIKA